jgi:hypothetical protein
MRVDRRVAVCTVRAQDVVASRWIDAVQRSTRATLCEVQSETKGEVMKVVDMLKALSVVVCVAVASSAYAQSSDAMAAPDAATSAKTTKKVNRKLGLDVRRALSKAQGIDVSNIFVRARGGAVVLTGTVPDGAQIPQAGEVAKGVPGVTSVSNKLTLGQPNGGGG